ncbi:hypothetical protein LINPERPRIM_LOCUS30426 [Linum perenne]
MQLFFPIHDGQNYKHFYLFVLYLKRHHKVVLNKPCDKEFDKEPWFKDTFCCLLSYDRQFLGSHLDVVEISKWQWHVLDCPKQPDGNSCGIFVMYFMEYFDGDFTDEQRSMLSVSGELDIIRKIYAHKLAMVEDNNIWEMEEGKVIVSAY